MLFEWWFGRVVCWLTYGLTYGAIYHLSVWTYREMVIYLFILHLTLLSICRHLPTVSWPNQFTVYFSSVCPICLWLFLFFSFCVINRFQYFRGWGSRERLTLANHSTFTCSLGGVRFVTFLWDGNVCQAKNCSVVWSLVLPLSKSS